MNKRTLAQQTSSVANDLGHVVIAFINMHASKQGYVIEKASVLVDCLRHLDAVSYAQDPVIGAMPRRDVDKASAFLGGGEIGF